MILLIVSFCSIHAYPDGELSCLLMTPSPALPIAPAVVAVGGKELYPCFALFWEDNSMDQQSCCVCPITCSSKSSLMTTRVYVCMLAGAPKGACVHLVPKHEENVAQTKSSPFRITANSNAGASDIDITIMSPSGEKFKGFLIQARSPTEVGNGMGKNLGQFKPMGDMSQTLKCNSTAVSIC